MIFIVPHRDPRPGCNLTLLTPACGQCQSDIMLILYERGVGV